MLWDGGSSNIDCVVLIGTISPLILVPGKFILTHSDIKMYMLLSTDVSYAVLHKCYRGICISNQEYSDRIGFGMIMHAFFSKMEDNEKKMGSMVELFERNSRE